MKKVVILGGGFGGLHLAKKLSGSSYRVILVDKQNHHQFQPLFYQVATARLEPSTISFPFRKIFQRAQNVEFRMAEVKRIEAAQNKVVTAEGELSYDHLVIATGCKTNFFGNELMASVAYSMKTTQEAINLRNEILIGFEKYISESHDEKKALLNIVIVGGGPTGVELCGAFAEMKRDVLPKDYPHVDFSGLTITLLEGSANTLNSMSDEAKKASLKYLLDMGVVVRTATIVANYDGTTLRLKTGEEIKSKTVIWAAGVIANVIPGLPAGSLEKNRYVVDRYNKIQGFDNIYAIGDVAYMETPKYPAAHPQLANVAINQGKNLGENFLAVLKNGKRVEYEYNDMGSMATIGRFKAVVDLPRWKFQGLFAWFVWMFLHLMLILSAKNKLMIFIDWSWNFFTRDSSLRLIFKKTN